MNTVYLGIDPGLDGWMVELNVEGNVYCQQTPTLKIGKGKSGKRAYDVAEMRRMLYVANDSAGRAEVQLLAVLEKQQAMRGQGVTSTFSTGRGYGLWEGLLAGLEIPYTVAHPRTWQAKAHRDCPGDDTKARSIIAASRLFPGVDLRKSDRARKPDHNKADALLLAWYGKMQAVPATDDGKHRSAD